MIVFLYGSDSYRRLQKQQEVVKDVLANYPDAEQRIFDFSENGSVDECISFLRAASLFASRKLVIGHGLYTGVTKELTNEIRSLLENANTTVVLLGGVRKPPKELAFLLKKPVITYVFGALSDSAWRHFVRDEATARGFTLAGDALTFLAEVYAGNSWGVATELDKLWSWGKRSISKRDLQALGLEVTPEFWGSIIGLKHTDVRRRLTALERAFLQHEPAAKTFNILSAQWPERVQQFARHDLAVKSGKLEYDEALLDVVLS